MKEPLGKVVVRRRAKTTTRTTLSSYTAMSNRRGSTQIPLHEEKVRASTVKGALVNANRVLHSHWAADAHAGGSEEEWKDVLTCEWKLDASGRGPVERAGEWVMTRQPSLQTPDGD